MLLHLLKQCEQDHDYVVIPCLKGLSNKLTGLFWMISQQQNELWSKFHDVVIYDSTAKTNRYKMTLNLFVEINNNFKIRVLAQTLIKYETQADYNWILCYILEATHIFPAVLFTDEDLAMNAAIQVVYPQICYLLCIYHITENIKKKARSKLYGEMVYNFIKDFYHM
ncbi:unnamed protein product [Rhizophagus irregularis]|nr:unnamed protein product [Rhizophagus irregularis]